MGRERVWRGFLIIAVLAVFSLALISSRIGSSKDERLTVKRLAIHNAIAVLVPVREAAKADLHRLEREFIKLHQEGVKAGDPDEEALRTNLAEKYNRYLQLASKINELSLVAEAE